MSGDQEVALFQSVDKGNLIGNGSFGLVFLGIATRHDGATERVAIKQINIVADDIGMEVETNFQEEAAILCRLNHANIVRFYCRWYFPWLLADGTVIPYENPNAIIMEYIPDGSLERLLTQTRNDGELISWGQRLSILRDICAGLQYLHDEMNLMHLDLKTENVLLSQNREGFFSAKLADFGLTRTRGSVTRADLGGNARGTVEYMAPEIFDANPTYSSAADIYAFAIIFWMLATHEMPYENMNTFAIITQVSNGRRLDFTEQARCPPRVRSLIEECWLQERTQRPEALEIINRLTALPTEDIQLGLEIQIEMQNQAIVILRNDLEQALSRINELENELTNKENLWCRREAQYLLERNEACEQVNQLELDMMEGPQRN